MTYSGYLFVDLETGGLKPQENPITQIAAIRTDLDFNIRGYMYEHVRPPEGLKFTQEAIDVTGIKPESLINEPEEKRIADLFLSFCRASGDLRFAGYNTKFDMEFLEHLKVRTRVDAWGYWCPSLCLFEEAKTRLPNLPKVWNEKRKRDQSHTLELVAGHFGIKIHGAHNCAADIYATVEIARKLMR